MIYRVSFISNRGSLQIVNTLHVWAVGSYSANPNPSSAQIAGEINTALTTLYRAMLPTQYTLDRIAVTSVVHPNQPSEVPSAGEVSVGLAGTLPSTTDDLPDSLCGRITWRTGNSGRSFRGRMFCPPLMRPENIVDGKIPAGGSYRAAQTAFADKVVNANLAGGSTWSTVWLDTYQGDIVVYSPTRHGLNLTPYYSPITSYVVRDEVSLLRSRRS